MNVTLPDGTVINDVPDGMSKADLTAKLKRNGYDVSKLETASKADQPFAVENGPMAAVMGMGKGVGSTVLGAQKYLGKGIDAVGGLLPHDRNLSSVITGGNKNAIEKAGQWLVKDAEQGRAKLSDELAPYKKESPYYAGGGELAGEIAATLPVGGVLARGVGAIAPKAVAVRNALRSGGMTTGGGTNLLKDLALRSGAGATVGGVSAGLTNDEAGTGAVIGGALPGVLKVAGAVGNAASGAMKAGAQRLMQSAVKPTIAQLRTGDADIAVQALLDYGINPTKAGVNKIRDLIGGLNDEIALKIADSNATVRREKVLEALGGVRSKFDKQVNPASDMKAIQNVSDEFVAHPAFKDYAPTEAALKAALAKTVSEKETALQAAGKLQTMAAQQKSLAHGATFRLARNQPEFQPYYNTGGMGRDVTSPSSLPVPGYPRIPGRYTHNIDRVPEGDAGAQEAMAIFHAKRLQESDSAKALEELQLQGATMPVQLAQKMKQGTYQVLSKKYGQLGSAETEAQKGLARGLKEEIASAVPGVQSLNAEESRLITTMNVAERRALMELNKNPMGLAALAHNPMSLAMFMADRSAAFKSVAARMINSAAPGVASTGQGLSSAANNPLLRTAAIQAISSNKERK